MGVLTWKYSVYPVVNNNLGFCLHIWNQRGWTEDFFDC